MYKEPAKSWKRYYTAALPPAPGGANGNPLQYSCLKNPMDIAAWRATVHGVTKESDKIEQLSA